MPDELTMLEQKTRRALIGGELSKVKGLYFQYASHLGNPDEILRKKASGKGYGFYDNMIDQDSHLCAVIQTRVNAITKLDYDVLPYVEPGGDEPTPEDQKIADFVKWVIEDVADWKRNIREILHYFKHGFSVNEIIYKYYKSQIVIDSLKSRHPKYFGFDDDNNLLYSEDGYRNSILMPADKFVVGTFDMRYESPYGTSLCKTVYWPHWFKFEIIKFLMVFSERLGIPAIIGKCPAGWSKEARQEYLEELKTMRGDSVFVAPDGVEITTLQTGNRREANFIEAINFFNSEISKRVLGQTLTTEQGEVGALALGQVHNEVRGDILEADARDLGEVITSRIVRPLVQINFGYDTMIPQYILRYKENRDLNKDAETLGKLVDAGLKIPVTWAHENFDIPVPEEGEEILERRQQPNPFSPGGPEAIQFAERRITAKYDIAILGTIYDSLYTYVKSIIGNIETDLLISIADGSPLAGLIDQSVRNWLNVDYMGKLTDLAGNAVYQNAKNMAAKFGQSLSESVFQNIKDNYIRDRFYEKGKVVDKMADTMQKLLKNSLPDWSSPEINFDVKAMKKAIKSQFADLKDWKVEQIARTEMSQAAHEASFEVIERTGISNRLEAYFLVDPTSCDQCQEWAANSPYTIEQARAMGLPHPNCNDQWTFVLKKEI